MKICIVPLVDKAKFDSRYESAEKIADKFKTSNSLIVTEIMSIEDLRNQVVSSGSRYEHIVCIPLSPSNSFVEQSSQYIIDIAEALGPQTIHICDTEDTYTNYLTDALINYTSLKYHLMERKTPGEIYNSVFGVTVKTPSASIETAMENATITPKAKPMPKPKVQEEAPIPAKPKMMPKPKAKEEVEEKPAKQKKGFTFPWKKKIKKNLEDKSNGIKEETETTVSSVSPKPIPSPVSSPKPIPSPVSSPESIPSSVPSPKPIPSPVPSPAPISSEPANTIEDEEDLNIPEIESSIPVSSKLPIENTTEDDIEFPDDMFVSEDEVNSVGNPYAEMFNNPTPPTPVIPHNEPLPASPVIKSAPAPTPVIESSGKKGFGKKIKLPKVSKEGLSMQTRPRIVFVTGTGRIGKTTLTSSLGFTAAQYYCRSLIVDLDMINRGISCIFPDYNNENSQQSLGLLSAIRSPHLVDEMATEHYDKVSTLGISLQAEDNRDIMNSIKASDLQALLLNALAYYNLVVVDIPWDYLINNLSLCAVTPDILFVTSNDLMTMISSLSHLTSDSFENLTDYQMVLSKLKFVLNMSSTENVYEKKTITEKNFSNICVELTDDEMFGNVPVLSNIPFVSNVGNQVALARPASSYLKEFEAFCSQILHSLN